MTLEYGLAIKKSLNNKIEGAVKESEPTLVKNVLGNHDFPRPAQKVTPTSASERVNI